MENVIGDSEADTIRGNSRANRLIGGPWYDAGDIINGRGGDDVLRGAGGDDVLRGGEGDDILRGARGADQLDGGNGTNRNDGGRGRDSCVNPDTGPLAIDCESRPGS